MSDWKNVEKFKEEAEIYLKRFGLKSLRAYGRNKGLRVATKLTKNELITQTIAVCCGEQKPDPTKRGAPRKNEFIPPELLATMDELIRVYLRGEAPMPTPTPIVKEEKRQAEKPYYKITVQKGNGEEVLSLDTNLDFQIILSNQKTITSVDMAERTDEKAV